MAHELCRQVLTDLLTNASTAHPGLLLRRGITRYEKSDQQGEQDKGGRAKQALITRLAGTRPSGGYVLAYRRWQQATADARRFAQFSAKLTGRLYIGVDRENPLETGITVQHAWGMPMIPGSALKGLARQVAREQFKGKEAFVGWLFGAETEATEAEAGAVTFHDAWWDPQDGKPQPFVAEVVTPHHREYYQDGGKPATDFDSPVPAPQIAAQGGFLFVIEGAPEWTAVARKLLEAGLRERGIGGKRSSGYGYFDFGDHA